MLLTCVELSKPPENGFFFAVGCVHDKVFEFVPILVFLKFCVDFFSFLLAPEPAACDRVDNPLLFFLLGAETKRVFNLSMKRVK